MPLLSMWNPRKGNDYKFIDKMVKAHFEHGGTAVLIHKYIGTGTGDETSIQDSLFLENRDRNYDDTVYELRGNYNITDQDFDLSQFGLFLGTDQQVFTVHLNDMAEKLGISAKTLQRRLAVLGLKFQSILDETRLAMAKKYLANNVLNLNQISIELGFTEPRSFYRWFNKITQQTPGDYRKKFLIN